MASCDTATLVLKEVLGKASLRDEDFDRYIEQRPTVWEGDRSLPVCA